MRVGIPAHMCNIFKGQEGSEDKAIIETVK